MSDPDTTPLPEGKLAYTVEEAADAIGVHRATIYRMVAAGELVTIKLGRRTLVRREVLTAFLDRLAA